MKMNQKSSLTAHKLMILLSTLLLLIFLGTAGAFVYAHRSLTDVADTIAQVSTEAEESQTRVQQLQKTEQELKKYSKEIERAAHIVAESQSYQYQDQIINDLTDYANRAGVSITSFNFSQADGAATSGTPAATPAPGMGGSEAQTPNTAPAASAAPKSTNVVINLGTEVQYNDLLNFMSLIEKNLTKMQIANITLSKAAEGGDDKVSIQSLSIEVYIK